MNSRDTSFKNEGYILMGAAFEVYNELGSGLLEEIYQESLELELRNRRIPFDRKREIQTYYKGFELRKRYIPDLIVFDGIIVELKSVSVLLPEHDAQLFNYLKLTGVRVGYLLNFGHKDMLEWKRFLLPEISSPQGPLRMSADQ
jgi:GxxExxY protein